LHLIHFFNPETLNISRFSVYMAYATLRYQQALFKTVIKQRDWLLLIEDLVV
jgi:hypothetical protein